MLTSAPPNGRKGRQPNPQGSQGAATTHGLHSVGRQGWHAIGSHGWQATCSQGLQPFQTTERRPKMPASAQVEAAKMTIAVNIDTTILFFISILLKIRLGLFAGNDCHHSVTGVIGKNFPLLNLIAKISGSAVCNDYRNTEQQFRRRHRVE
jgi:hypothetical protein